MRSATVSGLDRLPDARAVRRLSEQQRIALSRENAAAVQRAVSEAHRDTIDVLAGATDGLSELTGAAVRTVNATILAALGIVAIVGRNAGEVSAHLTWIVAASVVIGLVAVAFASWQRVGDYRDQVVAVGDRIKADPLTPEEDKELSNDRIAKFDVHRRSTVTRWLVIGLSVLGSVVVLGSAADLSSHAGSGATTPQPTPSVTESP